MGRGHYPCQTRATRRHYAKKKLKTLKDLDKYFFEAGFDGYLRLEDKYCKGEGHLIEMKELRQEAIKWIKQWRDMRMFFGTTKVPKSLKEQADEIMMSFFNITEEDLA